MSTAKSLSDEQIATIQAWAEDGDSLSDIQKKLASELEVKVTYLETRFLLEDLKIELKPEPVPEPESEEEEEPESEAPAEEELPEGAGGVSVTIDKVVRPGAIVSGKANFAGGNSASWWLDQMGRLGMDADDPDYKPSEQELMSFQKELQSAIQSSGL